MARLKGSKDSKPRPRQWLEKTKNNAILREHKKIIECPTIYKDSNQRTYENQSITPNLEQKILESELKQSHQSMIIPDMEFHESYLDLRREKIRQSAIEREHLKVLEYLESE